MSLHPYAVSLSIKIRISLYIYQVLRRSCLLLSGYPFKRLRNKAVWTALCGVPKTRQDIQLFNVHVHLMINHGIVIGFLLMAFTHQNKALEA
jgi:hypothetical protein